LGYFVWKITILHKKNLIFSNCEGRRENLWGISCEKSRFYAKKIIFFPILGGRGGAPLWIRPCYGTSYHQCGRTMMILCSMTMDNCPNYKNMI
jgi:hypothetical protein